jgi:hypothetical protein
MTLNGRENDQNWREGPGWGETRNQIQGFARDLDSLRQQTQADVLAFYLACDPFVTTYLRCLVAQGADYPEACSHFRLRPLDNLGPSAFYPDATKDPLRSGQEDDARVLNLLRQGSGLLFGDFVTRERIVSRGWFLQRNPETGRETALLTVNFRRPVESQEWAVLAPVARSRIRATAGSIRCHSTQSSRKVL